MGERARALGAVLQTWGSSAGNPTTPLLDEGRERVGTRRELTLLCCLQNQFSHHRDLLHCHVSAEPLKLYLLANEARLNLLLFIFKHH